MSWNIQFLAGNKDNFFPFENGTDAWPSPEKIKTVSLKVAKFLRKENPDIIMLQEVDKGAKRTAYIDQLALLLRQLPAAYANYACTYYWKINFLPHPAFLGPVGMRMCTVSKYQISTATRYALPSKLDINPFLQLYAPKRAAMVVELPLQSGKTLYTINVHNSTSTNAGSTKRQQMVIISNLLATIERQGQAGFLAGDFNSIASKAFIPYAPSYERSSYKGSYKEIQNLAQNFQMLPSLPDLSSRSRKRYLTYMPTKLKHKKPMNTIDFIFLNKYVQRKSFSVVQKGMGTISDHYPLVAEILLQF